MSAVRPSDFFVITKLMHVPDNKETGKLARLFRKDAGLSCREVARRMNRSAPYISDLELGRRNWNDSVFTLYREAVLATPQEVKK